MKKLFLFIVFCFLSLLTFSQVTSTSGDIYLGLRKLGVLGSVLYVAAHPDDENTRLLTYFSKERLYRTGYLSITRGDGGQNLIGNEQGVELGLIRTQELLAARRIDGAEQFFTSAYDFGYSKNPEETFNKWNKEKILADVVWIIRSFQPDIIVNRFPITGEGGHGHHTASGILANEAFTAAADPTRFPEQLKYVQPWQAKRIVWNSFNFGGTNTQREDQFRFDVGGYNAVLGKSYGEIAAESRSQHKSQGFGVPRTRGEALEYFSTTGGSAMQNDLFDDINTSWQRVKSSERIAQLIEESIRQYDFLQPQKTVPHLVAIYKALNQLPKSYWRDIKIDETQQLIEQACGLWIEAFTNQPYAVPGDSLRVNFVLNNRLGVDAELQSVALNQFDTTFNQQLVKNRNFIFSKTLAVKDDALITQPYWLQTKMEEGSFNVPDQTKIGAAEVIESNIATIELEINGQSVQFSKPVKYKFTDPVKGELYQPLVVIPAVVISPDDEVKLSIRDNVVEGTLNATSKKKNVRGSLNERVNGKNNKVSVVYNPKKLTFTNTGTTEAVRYKISAETDNDYHFYLNDDSTGKQYDRELHEIRYDHIPNITYFTPAVIKNRKLNITTKGKRVGYIVGAGDKVPQSLEQIGYEVVLLGEKEIQRNNLQQFDAIITGVRAYNTNDWMSRHYQKLMKYVENGGNLIVQYNTSNQLGYVRGRIGPYDFNITRTRVSDEKAPVTFLVTNHPVLNYPNKITADDFKDWVQERSIYHAAASDNNFQKILLMGDPGEKPDEGSLIISKYGKGYFTYTGLVFFRQLPAGNPGAFRLMANIIALNQQQKQF